MSHFDVWLGLGIAFVYPFIKDVDLKCILLVALIYK